MNLKYKFLLLKEYKFEILLTTLFSITLFFYKFITHIESYKIFYDLNFQNKVNLNKIIDQTYLDFVESINEYKYLIKLKYDNRNSDYRIQIETIVANSLNIEIFDNLHHKKYRPLYNFLAKIETKNIKHKIINYKSLGENIRVRLYSKNKKNYESNGNEIFNNHIKLINNFFNELFLNNLNNNLKSLYLFHENVFLDIDNRILKGEQIYNNSKYIEELEKKLIIVKEKFKGLASLDYIYLMEINTIRVNKNIYFNHFLETLILFLLISFLRKKFFNVK